MATQTEPSNSGEEDRLAQRNCSLHFLSANETGTLTFRSYDFIYEGLYIYIITFYEHKTR